MIDEVVPLHTSSDLVWRKCVVSDDADGWLEHLDRLEIADHFAFIEAHGATRVEGDIVPLHRWISAVAESGTAALYRQNDEEGYSAEENLALATYDRWLNRLERLLNTPEVRDSRLPRHGVLHYFGDSLKLCVLVSYRVIGSAVELLDVFPLPDPRAIADPVFALSYARSDRDLDVLRRSLYNRHKIVVQRNTLVKVDREQDVFGPSIDTVFLNDWLFEYRYLPQRTVDNGAYFEEILPRPISEEAQQSGTRFLEIGCGNGLLTAAYARNEVKVRAFAALDVSPDAVSTTYKNSANQRRVHRGSIGDRGIYQISKYEIENVSGSFDLVVCNPPYIPSTKDASRKHPLANATIGTTLLEAVVADAERLLAPDGILLIVASAMAEPELCGALTGGLLCERVAEMAVPFQVESVQSANGAEFLQWLIDQRGLRHVNRVDGTLGFEHTIAIWLIRHKEGQVQ